MPSGRSSSSAGFVLHFLFKCTEKGIFLLKITEKRGKTGPPVALANAEVIFLPG
jgi:hypothetical protein